jgi:hypothetical protein
VIFMYNIFIHIGLHKTGTTYLQNKVFPLLKDVNYISVFSTSIVGNKNFVLCEKLSKEQINLISDEALSGIPYDSTSSASRSEIANRLYRLYPNAKIIITFRNKDDWLKSVYKQYTKRDREKTGLDFNGWYNTLFDKSLLDFKSYEKYLKEKFSEVLVLDYEELRDNPKNYIKKLCSFIGVSVPKFQLIYINKSRSDVVTKRLQEINALLEKYKVPPSIRLMIRRIIMEIN